jgi:hypothetical protein
MIVKEQSVITTKSVIRVQNDMAYYEGIQQRYMTQVANTLLSKGNTTQSSVEEKFIHIFVCIGNIWKVEGKQLFILFKGI